MTHENGRRVISTITGTLVAGIALFGFFQAWAVLPHRVTVTEQAILVLQEEGKKDRELLIRIEERLKTLQIELNQKQP